MKYHYPTRNSLKFVVQMQQNHTPHSLLQSANQYCHINSGLQSLSKDRRENQTAIKNVTEITSVLKFYILETYYYTIMKNRLLKMSPIMHYDVAQPDEMTNQIG